MKDAEILQPENLTVENQELSQGELETISGGIGPLVSALFGTSAAVSTLAFYDPAKEGVNSIKRDVKRFFGNKIIDAVSYSDAAKQPSSGN